MAKEGLSYVGGDLPAVIGDLEPVAAICTGRCESTVSSCGCD